MMSHRKQDLLINIYLLQRGQEIQCLEEGENESVKPWGSELLTPL
jgi:hypothetical protein